MTPASQSIGAITAVGHPAFDDEDDWGKPEAWLDSIDMIGYAFRLPMDQLTTIVHKLLEAGGMGERSTGGEGFDEEEVMNTAAVHDFKLASPTAASAKG